MVRVYLFGKQIINKTAPNDVLRGEHIVQNVCEAMEINPADFYLLQNGRILQHDQPCNESDVHVQFRTLGGKGGFGSMLRAIGAQIEKTTNREACRDLSGRRLRDINEEKRLKAWLEKQKDREAEAEERKKRKVAKLLHVPKTEFKDTQYEEARSKLTEKVSDAVEEGLKKATEKETEKPNLKRKAATSTKVKNKKSALWIGDDISGSSASDSDDSEKSDAKPSTSKK